MKNRYAGLSDAEAAKLLLKHGPNELQEKKKESLVIKFLKQFTDFLILLLLAAAAIATLLGEDLDAIMILAVVFMHAILSFVQEYRAEKSFEALRRMVSPKAMVLRDGRVDVIDARMLVPGDVVLVEAGDRIPADGVVIESFDLATDEAALTGESMPVAKSAEEESRTYMGTIVVSGKGRMLVEQTGMATRMGEISEMVQSVVKEQTPIEKDLEIMGKQLGVAIVALCAVIFLAGTLRGFEPFSMFLTSVSLAVAAIPEGLPAVVVVTLAVGVQRMSRRNAIVKKLKSVETLGCADVICTDKTGTLTKNEMTVRKILLDDKIVDVSGSGYEPRGGFSVDGKEIRLESGTLPGLTPAAASSAEGGMRGCALSKDKAGHAPWECDLKMLMKTAVLCNNAYLKEEKAGWQVIGDPTEGSLLVLGAKGGTWKESLEAENAAIVEFPFDSARKMMAVVRKDGGKNVAYVKGAPEVVLTLSTRRLADGKTRRLSSGEKEEIEEANNALTAKGYRTLALAYRELDGAKLTQAAVEKDLTFIGIAAMMDSPREEVKDALRLCRSAGIRVIMITGDHPLTAKAIAEELGIGDGSRVVTGEELDRMGQDEFHTKVDGISVYARVSPAHKLRIVEALNYKGHVVAMTGDGVNDAPALKKADIGVAMGITGTEVAKESGDMVLADDNFASIVAAIEEGRGIYDNIRKTVAYLLAGNIAEVGVIFFAVMLGMPLPLIAIQILWINLVTDGLPAIALAVDPIDREVMNRKPRKKGDSIWKGMGIFIFESPAIVTIATIGAFMFDVTRGDMVLAQSLAFTVMVMFEKTQAFSCRSLERPIIRELFANKWLVYTTILTLGMQVAILYTPLLNELFHVKPLGITEWVLAIGLALFVFSYMEIRKWMKYNGKKEGR
ncbi:cation-translocating P-type ATPase [Candidatus Micrarchaeota archaeon]|nr:cation-translocating P-type ATPase [Candidatus Micrarchaeota archaeon]